jgi:hypothetical protein
VSTSIGDLINAFCESVQSTHKALVLAETCHILGEDVIETLGDDVLVTSTIGLNIEFEPIPMAELKIFKAAYPGFLAEVFHAKLVQYWHELLDRAFERCLELHMSGARQFTELGSETARINFADTTPLPAQFKESLTRDFRFWKSAEKYKLVAKVFDPSGSARNEADIVLCHVHLRNSLQHHQGLLNDFIFKEIGRTSVIVLDDTGLSKTLRQGDRVVISVPEFDRLRRALLLVAQKWRA